MTFSAMIGAGTSHTDTLSARSLRAKIHSAVKPLEFVLHRQTGYASVEVNSLGIKWPVNFSITIRGTDFCRGPSRF